MSTAPDPPQDRNVMLGLLAVQMGFLDRDRFAAALQQWIADGTRTLGDVLLARGDLDDERLRILEAVLGRASGVVPAVRPTTPSRAGRRPEAEPAAPPRYRTLRPLAVGGLGTVSVAEEEDIRREVALKEIRPEFADDPAARARFLREARVTGRLEHPGIVPVYGLGRHADGRPFYAMRYVGGETLRAAIDRLHRAREPHTLAARMRPLLGHFVAACRAVAFAHSRGYAHRDLKPGIILLGDYGETLVLDWSLAAAVGDGDDLTPSPDPAGRPAAYAVRPAPPMPATQAPAVPDATAGDVFALGATLYELLTGRPPGDGRSLSVPTPPPRLSCPPVSPALEAVCRKAMADGFARYPSPAALADDVERFLADLPVAALPESFADRAGRFVGRHRTKAAAALAVLALGVAGLTAGLAVALSRRPAPAEPAAPADRVAREAAESTYRAAREDPVLADPTHSDTRAQVLSGLLPFFDRVAEGSGAAATPEQADARCKAAYIRAETGDRDAALSGLAVGRARLEECASAAPSGGTAVAAARALIDEANLLSRLRQSDRAAALLARAEALLPAGPPADGEAAGLLATVLHARARSVSASGRHEEARELLRRAVAAREAAYARKKTPARLVLLVAALNDDVAARLDFGGDDALAAAHRAAELAGRAVTDMPGLIGPRRDLATGLANLSRALRAKGDTTGEREHIEGAITHAACAVERMPADAGSRRQVASLRTRAAVLDAEAGKREVAAGFARAAVADLDKLHAAAPDDAGIGHDLAAALLALGNVSRPDGALSAYERATVVAAPAASARPAVAAYQLVLLRAWAAVLREVRPLGDAARTLGAAEAASRLADEMAESAAPAEAVARIRVIAHLERADAHRALGRAAEAVRIAEAVETFAPARELLGVRCRRAEYLVDVGRLPEVRRIAAEVAALPGPDQSRHIDVARIHARLALRHRTDSFRPLPIKEADIREEVAKARRHLELARGFGPLPAVALRTLRDGSVFAELRRNEDFAAWLKAQVDGAR